MNAARRLAECNEPQRSGGRGGMRGNHRGHPSFVGTSSGHREMQGTAEELRARRTADACSGPFTHDHSPFAPGPSGSKLAARRLAECREPQRPQRTQRNAGNRRGAEGAEDRGCLLRSIHQRPFAIRPWTIGLAGSQLEAHGSRLAGSQARRLAGFNHGYTPMDTDECGSWLEARGPQARRRTRKDPATDRSPRRSPPPRPPASPGWPCGAG